MAKEARKGFLRSTAVIAFFTLLSRITGLLREQVRAYYLGTGMGSDAFGIAATIPNMMRRMFAEGAMTQAFLPSFSEYKSLSKEERDLFFSGFMTIFILVMLLVTTLGIIFAGPLVRLMFGKGFGAVPGKVELTIKLTQIIFPYLFLISIAAMIQATLNAYKVFGPSAFTPVLLNLTLVGSALLFAGKMEHPSYAFAIAFSIGGFFQLIFQIPWLRRFKISFFPTLKGLKHPGVRGVFRIFMPGMAAAGVYQVNLLISRIVASTLEQGAVSSLQFSSRLQEIVLGIFAVSIATVLLPTLSRDAVSGDSGRFRNTLKHSTALVVFITLPASLGLIVLARPIVTLLYGYGSFGRHSIDMTVFALYFHASGIVFIALLRNVIVAFSARKDLKTPAIIAGIDMFIHLGLCLALSGPLKQGGIALAGSISAFVNLAALLYMLRRSFGRLGLTSLAGSFTKTVIASLTMAGTIWLGAAYLGIFAPMGRLAMGIRLFAVIIAGIIVFLGTSIAVKSEETHDVIDLLKARFSSKTKS